MRVKRNFIPRFLRFSKREILAITITVIITLVISSIVSLWLSKVANLNIPSMGTIKTLGVKAYWDKDLKNVTKYIDWATIWPGSSQNVTLYVLSVSNIETTLHLNATNWHPTDLSDYMSLSWDYNGTKIQPSEVIQVTVTLSASSSPSFIFYLIDNDMKQFSFDIIMATQE